MARHVLWATLPVFVALAMLGACTELKTADVGATDEGGDTPAQEEDAEGADAGGDAGKCSGSISAGPSEGPRLSLGS